MYKHGRFTYSFQWYFVTVNGLKSCQKDEVADEHRFSLASAAHYICHLFWELPSLYDHLESLAP